MTVSPIQNNRFSRDAAIELGRRYAEAMFDAIRSSNR
jgi:hypothetical protein